MIFDIVYLATGEASRFASEGGADGIAAPALGGKAAGIREGVTAMRKVVPQFSCWDPQVMDEGVPALSAAPSLRVTKSSPSSGAGQRAAPLDMGLIARI